MNEVVRYISYHGNNSIYITYFVEFSSQNRISNCGESTNTLAGYDLMRC